MTHNINHLAIVVPNLDEALHFWRDALGLNLARTEENPDEKVNIAFVEAGSSHIELLQPTDPESGIARYMEKRGAGMHHVCIEVEDIEATMQRLREHNIELINDTPKTRPTDQIRYAFIHPRSTNGVLVELYELP
ncbi:MAG: methylmalonyl-CoA epimerase [Phototrophicales bacterium]|nr:MAG: methylmalonyl-CoA epimerase [Phototrophicales bacterium]